MLVYIGVIFIVILIVALKKDAGKNIFTVIALGLIIGGALSNMFDRIVYGFVVDYIDLRVWPVFNLSDMCISVGVGVLFLRSFARNEEKHISK